MWSVQMKKEIILPAYILKILERFKEAGSEAFVAGGAVRDGLLGRKPVDFDLCTPAMPEETEALFSEKKVIRTGIRHGTVTVLSEGGPVEITTYRREGKYSDGRHPDEVTFVSDLREDLSRRDFTVNAMAYSPETGVIDYFGGIRDLEDGILRCVGNPEERFSEDGLRIMRALRFMSVRGYQPDPGTDAALRSCCQILKKVAFERIDEEFLKFLSGNRAAELLDGYREVFSVIIPELRQMFDFDQKSPYHNRDVWHHTLAAVGAIRPDPQLRMTMLLHDIAKPVVYREDENGRGHFRGHQKRGAEMAEVILRRMKFPKEFIEETAVLVREHDLRIHADRPVVRLYLGRLGVETLKKLMEVQLADASGKYAEYLPPAEERVRKVLEMIDKVIEDKDCICLSDLEVGGKDLLGAGLKEGRAVGETLDYLLGEVIHDRIPNEKNELLKAALDHQT